MSVTQKRPENDSLPPIDGGENILLCSPDQYLGREVAYDILEEGHRRGDGTVVITTTDPAPDVLDDLESSFDVYDRDRVGVVDTVSKQKGVEKIPGESVGYVASPQEFTGIGIQTGAVLEHLQKDTEQPRVMVDSVTKLAQFADDDKLYRFLHVFANRIQQVDGVGVFLLDPTAVSDKLAHLLMTLFDAKVSVEQSDDGDDYSVTKTTRRDSP